MLEIVYRYDPRSTHHTPTPATPAEARQRLCEGNREFVSLIGDPNATAASRQVITFDLADLGVGERDGAAPRQHPFALVLGCSDARAPTELIFHQASNALFVVRVAGNVLGDECLGSVEYAVQQLGAGLRLLVVMGHSGCGAVTAAVDTFLAPARYLSVAGTQALRAIVDRLVIPVRAAAHALERTRGKSVTTAPGYRRALIECGVVLNSAITARTLMLEVRGISPERIGIVYGVYNLVTRAVNLPNGVGSKDGTALFDPPADDNEFESLCMRLAAGEGISQLLERHDSE